MERRIKLVADSKPGRKVELRVVGMMPVDPGAVLDVAEQLLQDAETDRPGPHRRAKEAYVDGLLRRTIGN